jgi:hypothetical protein
MNSEFVVTEWVAKLPSLLAYEKDGLFPVYMMMVIIGIPCLTGVLMKFIDFLDSSAKHYQDVTLKSKLIDRGFTAHEIERICQLPVNKQKGGEGEWQPVPPAKPVKSSV